LADLERISGRAARLQPAKAAFVRLHKTLQVDARDGGEREFESMVF
jgi:hypothetical protein